MKKIIQFLFLLGGIGASHASFSAQLNIFACEPHWQALAQELGGDKVETFSATNPHQDPHYIEARPSLIAKARQADILFCTGAQLEVGWLPAIVSKSGNSNIANQSSRAFFATKQVTLLEIPEKVDRSQGDVHKDGNPHIHNNPYKLLDIAQAFSQVLIHVDSENTSYYRNRLDNFTTLWNTQISRLEEQAQALHGKKAIVHHRNWVYLFDWLGIEIVEELEPKAGVPPTISHLHTLINTAKTQQVDFIVYSNYQNPKGATWLSEKTGIKSIELPYTIAVNDNATNLFTWMQDIIDRLTQE